MKLHSPFEISARLLPALRIGKAWIQLEYSRRPGSENRTRYKWTLDLPTKRYFFGDDLQSGNGGGDLQSGFVSLLSFLSACGESYGYRLRTGREGENCDLFPEPVAEWAYQNASEISLLQLEIEKSETPLIEE